MSESSPRQETADRSTVDGDNSSSVECPQCDECFKSTRGMKIHHKRIHGESIAGVFATCERCETKFTTKPCRKSEVKYCSEDCRLEALHESMEREGNPNWVGRPIIECECCEEEFEVKKYELGGRRFCSDCWGNTGSTIECKYCGEEVYANPYRLGTIKYCSKECKGNWMSENLRGQNHPDYDPDATHDFGPNWNEQAEKCRKRDGHRCQSCGKHQSDHYRKLIAHHIIPRKEFMQDGELDYERANRLDNLVALCDSCHQRWEGLPVKPQLI